MVSQEEFQTYVLRRLDEIRTEITDRYLSAYFCTYGAYFSAQVQDKMNRGLGAPSTEDYKRFHEEAEAVAEEAAELSK